MADSLVCHVLLDSSIPKLTQPLWIESSHLLRLCSTGLCSLFFSHPKCDAGWPLLLYFILELTGTFVEFTRWLMVHQKNKSLNHPKFEFSHLWQNQCDRMRHSQSQQCIEEGEVAWICWEMTEVWSRMLLLKIFVLVCFDLCLF